MKQIICINEGKAYLPELKAYKKYFKSHNINFIDSYKDLNNQFNIKDYDLAWVIMGSDFKKLPIPVVHDYASLSTGKYIFLKDLVKRYFNKKPDLRLFLNYNIKNKMNFRDNIPFLIRDMGIDDVFFNRNMNKEYDFVYLGSVSKERKIPELLNVFKFKLKEKKLLVIGSVPEDLFSEYVNVKNITFTGNIDYYRVPLYASKAEYGLNIIPDLYPFNLQTSTKLLEYCALDLKIITTNYSWVNSFEKEYKGKFFKLKNDFSDIDIFELENFYFNTPNVQLLKWENIFDRINLKDTILKLINN
jgi:hypothetical protein